MNEESIHENLPPAHGIDVMPPNFHIPEEASTDAGSRAMEGVISAPQPEAARANMWTDRQAGQTRESCLSLLNVIDFGMPMSESVTAPRFSVTSDKIDISNRIPHRVGNAPVADG